MEIYSPKFIQFFISNLRQFAKYSATLLESQFLRNFLNEVVINVNFCRSNRRRNTNDLIDYLLEFPLIISDWGCLEKTNLTEIFLNVVSLVSILNLGGK